MHEHIIYGPTRDLEYLPVNNISQLFLEALRNNSNKYGQIDIKTGLYHTHGEFLRDSIRVAIEMRKRGIKAGDIVTICGRNHMKIYLPFTAALYVGATVNPMYPIYSPNEYKRMFELTETKLIFCDQECYQQIKSVVDQLNFKTEIVTFESTFELFLSEDKKSEEIFQVTPVDIDNDLALIICSSGTSGLLKGVPITHQTFYQTLMPLKIFLGADETLLLYGPVSWNSSPKSFFWHILQGHKIVVAEFNKEKNLEILDKYKITVSMFPPLRLIELINDPNFNNYDIPSHLKTVIFGGNVTTTRQIDTIHAAFKDSFILNGFGSTEISVCTQFNKKTEGNLMKEKKYSVGKLFPGLKAKIIDPETKQKLPRNTPGELLITGPTLMKGYFKDPIKTKAVIDNERWFHTGDKAYFDDDDCLYIIGRYKELLTYKTYRVSPVEIEDVILTHSAVQRACVVGLFTEKDGDLPFAFVVKKPSQDITEDEIIKYVEERVIDLQRLRGGVLFIDKFPMTPSGKIKREELKKLLPELNGN